MHICSFLRSVVVKDHRLLPLVAWYGLHYDSIIFLFDSKMNQEEKLTYSVFSHLGLATSAPCVPALSLCHCPKAVYSLYRDKLPSNFCLAHETVLTWRVLHAARTALRRKRPD